MYLKIRGLPSLTTASSVTTTTATSSSKATSTITSVTQSQSASSSISVSSSSVISSNSFSSSSHLSTSTIQATVVIPNQKNVPYDYYYPNDIDGTVYIAFGGVLGFLLLLIVLIWSILSFKSWYEARTQKHYRDTLKQNYNNLMYTHTNGSDEYFTNDSFKDEIKDPSSVATTSTNTSPSSSYNSRSSIQSSSHVSDISEKLLKQQQVRKGTDKDKLIARKSMTFINNHNNSLSNITNNNNNNNGTSNKNNEEFQKLFVSPTEVLFNGNKFMHTHNNSFSTTALSFSSVSSSPMHTFGLVSNNSSSNREIMSTPCITVNSGTPIHTGTSTSLDNSNMNNNANGNTKTKKFRPPSVHLDQLLDQQ